MTTGDGRSPGTGHRRAAAAGCSWSARQLGDGVSPRRRRGRADRRGHVRGAEARRRRRRRLRSSRQTVSSGPALIGPAICTLSRPAARRPWPVLGQGRLHAHRSGPPRTGLSECWPDAGGRSSDPPAPRSALHLPLTRRLGATPYRPDSTRLAPLASFFGSCKLTGQLFGSDHSRNNSV